MHTLNSQICSFAGHLPWRNTCFYGSCLEPSKVGVKVTATELNKAEVCGRHSHCHHQENDDVRLGSRFAGTQEVQGPGLCKDAQINLLARSVTQLSVIERACKHITNTCSRKQQQQRTHPCDNRTEQTHGNQKGVELQKSSWDTIMVITCNA